MKPQDITFLIILGVLVWMRRPRWFVWAGLSSLALSIPLFGKWIFFTAERLTWYGGALFLCFLLWQLGCNREVQKNV